MPTTPGRNRQRRTMPLALAAQSVIIVGLLMACTLNGMVSPCKKCLHRLAGVDAAAERNTETGVVPPEPSQASFLRIQADPGLVTREPALLAEFEAAPWLLPPNSSALPYAGVHDLEQLLALRAAPVQGYGYDAGSGNVGKAVALVPFNVRFAELSQNCVYSMVKFGGVRSYVALTWTPADLAACTHMNLPCADVTHLLYEPLNHGPGAGQYGTHDYLVIVWLKPAVTLFALQRGYITFVTDADVAFANKPIFQSFLELMAVTRADGAFQAEGPVNTGTFLLLPTAASIAAAQAWVNFTPTALNQSIHDQRGLNLQAGKVFRACDSTGNCARARAQIDSNSSTTMAMFRVFNAAFFTMAPNKCALSDLQYIPRVDPCDWTSLFVHAICLTARPRKAEAFSRMGWWYVDTNKDYLCPAHTMGNGTRVPICQPRQWRFPDTEARLYACRPGLGLINPGQRIQPPSPPPLQASSAPALR